MGRSKTLAESKKDDIERIKNRPALSVFKDNMSLGAILENAYIEPKYHLCKHNVDYTGIQQIYTQYKKKRVIFVGEGGAGKTSAFLRLYMGADKGVIKATDKTEFYYCFAPDLLGHKTSLNDYQKKLREILDENKVFDGVLLLDGIEEAYLENSMEAKSLLEKLSDRKIVFWVNCRTNFYSRLDNSIDSIFSEKIEINKWIDKDYNRFFDLCLEENDNKDKIKERINQVKPQIESLLCRPLFATMALFIAENHDIDYISNEYELIELFLGKWFERDIEDKKSVKNTKNIDYVSIQEVALNIYLNNPKRPMYNEQLSAFRDLLIMSNTKRGTIHGFYHREFLVYFIAKAMLDAALNNPENIILWFSQTFYDDITNMIKPVLNKMNYKESKKIFDNLFNIYKKTYEDNHAIEAIFEEYNLLPPEDSFLKLRDEVLYFIFRLHNIDHETFANYAYVHSTDIMLFLGIAYGMAGIDINNTYTIEFAKKLKTNPDTPENIRNRGWGMCFFGDVEEDGYKYIDSEKKPWNKVRQRKLDRINDNSQKSLSTRLLDIPLLYCYYSSRDFSDCISYKEYSIIKNANISLPLWNQEQRIFLAEQKQKLVDAYLKHLLLNTINSNICYLGTIQREDIMMNNETNKTVLEIDKKLTDRILKQIEYKEATLNNLEFFWNDNGKQFLEKYTDMLKEHRTSYISQKDFKKKIKECRVLIISANSVEGAVVTHRLMDISNIDACIIDGCLFQHATIDNEQIIHIWPRETSSFTQFGSFNAVNTALNNFSPKYIISVGVAFGVNPDKQRLGDVLVSKELVFYDNFNKVTDGVIKLDSHETYRIDKNLEAQLRMLNLSEYNKKTSYNIYFGSMLTGGTVLSDAFERNQLIEAAENIGQNIIGGEMEGSGIYYACQKIKDRHIPFLIVKGICDWGAEKNGWQKVIKNNQNDSNRIKDCVQAFACNNAFDTMCDILSNLDFTKD